MLYDYAFVFHPGYEQVFQRAGHPKAVFLPHAVEAELFQGAAAERTFDVGWVGSLRGELYSRRRRCIDMLKARFHMNDIDRHYSPEELAALYRRSKIVVNISRDDYLSDANLRCFEAMAAGALLITTRPTELTRIGFKEDVHFVTFSGEKELHQKVRLFSDDYEKRREIADAAQKLVLEQHTYDERVDAILALLDKNEGRLSAPARSWSKVEVHAIYLHYFAKHLMLDATLRELREIKAISRKRAAYMLPLVGKAVARSIQMSI
jgi:glycosyltransferase involved in cell wall biosynthesis